MAIIRLAWEDKMDEENLNRVSGLSPAQTADSRQRLASISPDDGKYAQESLRAFLTPEAEWRACAKVQRELLAVRVEFGQAKAEHLAEVDKALEQIDPLNMALLEEQVTKHDQLAVLEELGRYIRNETKALLHPGTTSYDVVDTARSWLFRECWEKCLSPQIARVGLKLCELARTFEDVLQVGRTHLQKTSPVPFGLTFSGYAARIAERHQRCDAAFKALKGKVAGIVGTGSSVAMVIGPGKALEFERQVLARFGLEPDYTATQVVQKERLADVGNALSTLMHVLGDFADDMRILYSSDVNEVTSRDAKKRLGGSSADAAKNNPINWENIAGKVAVVESGMRVLYAMINTDLQRDLRSSVQGRYQPQGMMAEVMESFVRAERALNQLSINTDTVAANLQSVRDFPSEAMVAILRGHGFTRLTLGIGHDAVKEFAKKAQAEGRKLLAVALEDKEFRKFYESGLSENEQKVLRGELEHYIGPAKEKMAKNIEFAEKVLK